MDKKPVTQNQIDEKCLQEAKALVDLAVLKTLGGWDNPVTSRTGDIYNPLIRKIGADRFHDCVTRSSGR